MSDLVLAESMALVHKPEIRLRFVAVSEGEIAVFTRTCPDGEDPEERSPVYCFEEGLGWRPRILGETVVVSMFDVCPYVDLKPHEYRFWHEHALIRMVRGLRGSGTLTISHRVGWPWHFGLAWSRHPLRPKMTHMTQRSSAPKWWGAEDLWCELGGDFEGFRVHLERRQYLRNLDYERREAQYRRLVEQGHITPPASQTPGQRERFRQQFARAINDTRAEPLDVRLLL